MEIIEYILTAYIIPLVAIIVSYFFWIKGRDSAIKAEQLLDEVTRASSVFASRLSVKDLMSVTFCP